MIEHESGDKPGNHEFLTMPEFVISEDTRFPRATGVAIQMSLDSPFPRFPLRKPQGEDDTPFMVNPDEPDRYAGYSKHTISTFGESQNSVLNPLKFSSGFRVEEYGDGHWDIRVAPSVDLETQRILEEIMAGILPEEQGEFWSDLVRMWPVGKLGKSDCEIEISNNNQFLTYLDGDFIYSRVDENEDLHDFEIQVVDNYAQTCINLSSITPVDAESDAEYEVIMGIELKWLADQPFPDDDFDFLYQELEDMVKNKTLTEKSIKEYFNPYIRIRKKLEMV